MDLFTILFGVNIGIASYVAWQVAEYILLHQQRLYYEHLLKEMCEAAKRRPKY